MSAKQPVDLSLFPVTQYEFNVVGDELKKIEMPRALNLLQVLGIDESEYIKFKGYDYKKQPNEL